MLYLLSFTLGIIAAFVLLVCIVKTQPGFEAAEEYEL